MATSSSRPQQAWLIHITNVDSHSHAQAHSLLACFQDKRAEYFAEIVNILVTVGNISDCLPVHTSKDINNWTFAIIIERKKKKKKGPENIMCHSILIFWSWLFTPPEFTASVCSGLHYILPCLFSTTLKGAAGWMLAHTTQQDLRGQPGTSYSSFL